MQFIRTAEMKNENQVEPVMHIVQEGGGVTGCSLRVLFNSTAIGHLVVTGHAECLLRALADAQVIVEGLLEQVEFATACTTTRKPC